MTEEESAIAVVRFLIAVAHADGRLDTRESDVLRAAMQKLPISELRRASLEEQLVQPPSIADAAANLERDEDKLFVLQHALRVAYADGDYSPPEREKIQWLADQLKVSRAQLESLESKVAATPSR